MLGGRVGISENANLRAISSDRANSSGLKDECVAISLLVNEDYLQRMQRRYLDMLHPIQADKKVIADYWRQC